MTAAAVELHATEPQTIDPTALVIDANVRAAVVLDKLFKDSIKEHGVLVPLVVRIDPLGQYLVVDGQRRTLAALEVGLDRVPVVLTTAIADDGDRIVTQAVVNEHRAGLTAADQANTVRQLSLFGMSPTQIARKMSRPKADVAAALAVAGAGESVLAAVQAHPDLDLQQAAVLTEFADDAAAVEELAACAVDDPAGFDHEVQRIREKRVEAAAIAAKTDELEARGVRVLTESPRSDKLAENLSGLTDKPAAGGGYPPPIDEAEHEASCPGHAVHLAYYPWQDPPLRTYAYCMDWRTHGHFNRSARNTSGATSGEQSEDARAGRRRVIESNKAAVAAETVRRTFVAELLQRPKLPADAVVYAAQVLMADRTGHTDHGVRPILDALWKPSDPARVTTQHLVSTTQTPTDATRYLVALAAAIVEHQMPKDFWRSPSSVMVEHLRRLESWGYGLSSVEREVVDAAAAKDAS